MLKRLPFRLSYFLIAIVLLAIEILIAIFAKDNFVRPYVGDFLVVILIYCLLMAFCRLKPLHAALIVFCFACLIEWLQYLHIVSLLGLKNCTIARVLIGTSFEWGDILAYACGCISILIFEKFTTQYIVRLR